MPANRSRNLAELRRQTKEFRTRVAVAAVEDAQSIIEGGWKSRVPIDTGELRESIRSTPVRIGRRFVGGMVVATAPYAVFREFGTDDTQADPAMRDTIEQDGRRAEEAMIRTLERGIRG